MREWLFGRNAVYESLQARRRHFFRLRVAEGAKERGRLKDILEICRGRNIPIEYLPRKQLNVHAAGHQGVALQASGYPYSDLVQILEHANGRAGAPFLLILDTLQDPQNLGSLLRSAEAFGVHGVLLPLRRTATITPAVVNSSAGASEHLLIAQTNLAQAIRMLKSEGVWVVGLERVPDARPPHRLRLDGPLALVVGSEGEGMRPLTRKLCDVFLQLPMQGRVASLNAAVAGSIALYLARQERENPRPARS